MPPPEVHHAHHFLLLPPEAVGQGRRGGLRDDAQHAETRQLEGPPRGGLLRRAEARRHGDDGGGHLLPQVRLGPPLQLLEDLGGHRLGRQAPLPQHQLHLCPGVLVVNLVGHQVENAVVELLWQPPQESLDA